VVVYLSGTVQVIMVPCFGADHFGTETSAIGCFGPSHYEQVCTQWHSQRGGLGGSNPLH